MQFKEKIAEMKIDRFNKIYTACNNRVKSLTLYTDSFSIDIFSHFPFHRTIFLFLHDYTIILSVRRQVKCLVKMPDVASRGLKFSCALSQVQGLFQIGTHSIVDLIDFLNAFEMS